MDGYLYLGKMFKDIEATMNSYVVCAQNNANK